MIDVIYVGNTFHTHMCPHKIMITHTYSYTNPYKPGFKKKCVTVKLKHSKNRLPWTKTYFQQMF